MASILSRNSWPQTQVLPNNQQLAQAAAQPDPVAQINAVIQQILGSENPLNTFQQFVASSPDAQKAMEIVNKYGNGDFKTACLAYAAERGEQALAQQVIQKLGAV